VAAAAGAVGSIVGQIARLHGCRVVGLAGSDDKCRMLVEELGFDACINYKSENLDRALKQHCPKGIDVDFENVGGAILDAVLGRINLRARIVLCGLISQYNATTPAPGPYRFAQVLVQRARIEGFIILDYLSRFPEGIGKLAALMGQGKLVAKETVVEGFEHTPLALAQLFSGDNVGKLVVRVS
jgi:NADPH-dependent curcumin reductase CurA